MYHLTVQNGAAKGATWELCEGVLLLGRATDCAIRIPNDTAVSRVHCELRMGENALAMKQLSERSVTLINGKVVQEAEIQVGDTLTVGMTTLLLGRDVGGSGAGAGHVDLGTRTIGEADAVYLGGRHSEDALSARVESLRELAELFRLSSEFNQADTTDGLLKAFRDAILERFAPQYAWIVRSREASDSLEYAHLIGDKSTPGDGLLTKGLRQAISAHEGALLPRAVALGGHQHVETTLISPLSTGGQALGAVALVSNPMLAPYDEHDLQFLIALCRAVAPCIYAVERMGALREEVAELRNSMAGNTELLGESSEMIGARALLVQAAQSTLNILILGESGTGKELAARMAHACSDQPNGPYVVVNCAAIPAEMLESELFGYGPGAFTGASGSREGLIARAHGGTLFLDEVGDLSPANQARVLRVLETGHFRKLGSDEESHSEFRTVSATNKDMTSMVASGAFRSDLYHRLNGFEITLAPLRERPADIAILANHFYEAGMARAKRPLRGIAPDAMVQIQSFDWPGNARQLKNRIERAIATAQGEQLEAADLGIGGMPDGGNAGGPAVSLVEAEKRHIASVLRQCKGDANAAAEALGLSRSTLYHKVKKFDLDMGELRDRQ